MRASDFADRWAAPRLLFLALALAAALTLSPGAARAQVFGQLTSAAVLAKGERTVGAYGLFQDEAWGGLGQLRAGLAAGFDAALLVGFASHDDTPQVDGPNTFLASVDLRRQLRWAFPGAPVDGAIAFGAGIETGDAFTRLLFVPSLLASHRIVYDDAGRAVTPQGSIGFAVERLDVRGFDDTDVDLVARVGGTWEPSSRLGVTAEFAFGGETQFLGGVRWPF